MLLAASSFAQSPKPVELEVASIKPFAPGQDRSSPWPPHRRRAQIRAVAQGLLAIAAYKIKATLISGPDWTATERFDLWATLPAGSTTTQLPEMFCALFRGFR